MSYPILPSPLRHTLYDQLQDRRSRLREAMRRVGETEDLLRVLREVDAALERVGGGDYGLCEICSEPVGEDLLATNPLATYCLCHLSKDQLAGLDRDLDLAWRIQAGLLPKQNLVFAGWETHFRYLPMGRVSGDYCDLVVKNGAERSLFFLLGDVSGKGVAASLLMAHLNALFRSLLDDAHPLEHIVERANNIFNESTLSAHYATLVAGRARETGEIQILNAGHCPPVVVRSGEVERVEATGFPVGLFQGNPYELHGLRLSPGETLFLYTDGLTEAGNGSSPGYGEDRLYRLLETAHGLGPDRMIAAVMDDLDGFLDKRPRDDDLTLLAIRREGSPSSSPKRPPAGHGAM